MSIPAAKVTDPRCQRNWDRVALYQYVGAGDPTGRVTAKIGAVYHRTDGGAGTSFYVKESDPTGNTGWQPK